VNDAPKVLTQMYQLPRLFGVWVLDPEYREALERSSGETVHPAAQIYLPNHVVQLNIERKSRFFGGLVTTARYLAYVIEGTEMFLQPVVQSKGGGHELGEGTSIAWAITNDMRLNVKLGDQWWRFVPTDLNGLRREGFDAEVLESVQATARKSGLEIQESFDVSQAEQLIQEEGGDPSE